MSDIDHAAEAYRIVNEFDPCNDPCASAQVHATLALVAATEKVAEQARIANLIALANSYSGELMSEGHRALVTEVPHPEWPNTTQAVLRDDIRKGLGL